MRVQKFTGNSLEEKKHLSGFKLPENFQPRNSFNEFITTRSDPPESLDYRELGYVTPVRDQGFCSCCYAYSAACSLEGQIFKKYGILQEISKQQQIDCGKGSAGNWGCNVGYL
jgi:C1A family cysteine protease